METQSGVLAFEAPLPLDSGALLEGPELAFARYGRLNAARDNAVLVLHGLTSDQHAAGQAPDGRPGWWNAMIGPGKAIDTERFCVFCPNALGGSGGGSGPARPDPATGRPYGLRFPLVTVGDNVALQARLAERFEVSRFHAVVGGCFGGFQALEWMARRPEAVARAVVVSATPRTSAHNTALWSTMRAAVFADPAFKGGDYYDDPAGGPTAGLALLGRFGALFWMSREVYERKFGLARAEGAGEAPRYGFEAEYAVESFLEQVGRNSAERLDANALLYLTRAIDYFDLSRGRAGLADAFAGYAGPTLLVSYRGDWRYPAEAMAEIERALAEAGAPCRHVTLDSAAGHGGFLHDTAGLAPLLKAFLEEDALAG